jgi:hypothetical protein
VPQILRLSGVLTRQVGGAAKRRTGSRRLPGKGWFTYFRLYAPTQPFFDKAWKLPDIKRMS